MAKIHHLLLVLLLRISALIVCINSMLLTSMADQVPSPSKPIVLHINISAVNVTWTWEGYGDVQYLVQVSDGQNFVNASQLIHKSYLIYGGMSVSGVYLFRVFAYQKGNASAPSQTSDLLINGVNAPSGPPENLRATAISTSQIALVWDPPSLTGGYSYHYSIYYDVNNDPWHMSMASGCIECETDSLQATINGLNSGTKYYFTVVADLAGQLSVFSEVANATTHTYLLPPVSSLTVLSVTYTTVTLAWSAPHIDPVITNYTVCYTPAVLATPTDASKDCTLSYTSQHFITKSNNATVSRLEQAMEYLFLVQYWYQNRIGNFSSPVNATTNSSLHCQLCQPQGPHSLLLQWTADNSSTNLQTFLVSLGDAGTVNKVVNSSFEVVSTVVDGLKPFTMYTASIAMDNNFGAEVQWVHCPQCRTGESVPTGPPQNVVATALSPSSVKLTWEPPSPSQQNGLIEYYQVLYKACNLNFVTTLIVDSALAVDIDGLEAGKEYCFEVAAATSVGVGPLSTPSAKLQIPEGLPTGPPTNIQFIAATDVTLTLGWDPPLADEQNGVIVVYTLRYAPTLSAEPRADAANAETSSQMLVSGRGSPLPEAEGQLYSQAGALAENYTEVNVSSLTVTLSQLNPETAYAVQIAARTAAGRGPWSDVMSFTTLASSKSGDLGCPSVVGVAVTILDHWTTSCTTTVFLAWNVTIVEGLLLQNLTLSYGDVVLDLDTEANDVNVTLDQPGQNYMFTLTAYVEVQNGSLLWNSSSTSITTTGCSTTLALFIIILIILFSVIGVALMTLLFGCITLCIVKYNKSHHRRRGFSTLFNNHPMSSPNAYVTSSSNFLLSRGDGRSSTSGSGISDETSTHNEFSQPVFGSLDLIPGDEDQRTPLLLDLRSPVPIQRPASLVVSDYLAFPSINGSSFTYSSDNHDSSTHSSNSLSLAPAECAQHQAEDTSENIPDRDTPEGSSLTSTSNVNVLNTVA